jgi:hypothetical protein
MTYKCSSQEVQPQKLHSAKPSRYFHGMNIIWQIFHCFCVTTEESTGICSTQDSSFSCFHSNWACSVIIIPLIYRILPYCLMQRPSFFLCLSPSPWWHDLLSQYRPPFRCCPQVHWCWRINIYQCQFHSGTYVFLAMDRVVWREGGRGGGKEGLKTFRVCFLAMDRGVVREERRDWKSVYSERAA